MGQNGFGIGGGLSEKVGQNTLAIKGGKRKHWVQAALPETRGELKKRVQMDGG